MPRHLLSINGRLSLYQQGGQGKATDQCVVSVLRVAKFGCPRVLDDQKMNEDNQNLRRGCPPDYQIFGG